MKNSKTSDPILGHQMGLIRINSALYITGLVALFIVVILFSLSLVRYEQARREEWYYPNSIIPVIFLFAAFLNACAIGYSFTSFRLMGLGGGKTWYLGQLLSVVLIVSSLSILIFDQRFPSYTTRDIALWDVILICVYILGWQISIPYVLKNRSERPKFVRYALGNQDASANIIDTFSEILMRSGFKIRHKESNRVIMLRKEGMCGFGVIPQTSAIIAWLSLEGETMEVRSLNIVIDALGVRMPDTFDFPEFVEKIQTEILKTLNESPALSGLEPVVTQFDHPISRLLDVGEGSGCSKYRLMHKLEG